MEDKTYREIGDILEEAETRGVRHRALLLTPLALKMDAVLAHLDRVGSCIGRERQSRTTGLPAADGPTLGGDARRLSIEAISARRNTRPKRPGRHTQGGGPSRDGTAPVIRAGRVPHCAHAGVKDP